MSNGSIFSYLNPFNWGAGAQLQALSTQNPEQAFATLQARMPALNAFANNAEFKKDLHTALQKPEFRNFIQTAMSQTGGADRLGAVFNNPQAQQFAPALMRLAAHDPNFDFNKLSQLTNQLSEHAQFDKVEQDNRGLTPEQTQQRQALRVRMSRNLSDMGVNVGLGANAMDPKILLTFIKDIFEKGPAQAVQGLMGALREGGASPQALASVERFGTVAGNFMQTFGQPYYEFGQYYGPRIGASLSGIARDASAMAAGGLTQEAQARIGNSANPAGATGQTRTAFNPNATGERTDGYRPETPAAPAMTVPMPSVPQSSFGISP